MKFAGLVVKSVRRNKRRTTLTVLSVAIAVFLFSSLRAVLDGFKAVSAASSSTRVVTLRSTSMIFSMPTSHEQTIRSTPGVEDVTYANWFGGIYKDPKNFFGQFAIDPVSYLRMDRGCAGPFRPLANNRNEHSAAKISGHRRDRNVSLGLLPPGHA